MPGQPQCIGALTDLRWPLTTERLRLRPATIGDTAAIWSYRRRPEVHEWLGLAPSDREAWDSAFAEPERLAKTVIIETDEAVVGDLMIASRDGWGQREVMAQAEALRAALGVCFAPTSSSGLGLRRITASCFVANEASWRLMERVGLRREQHAIGDSLHRDLGWVDGYYYALLADEWSAMSERD